jgi:DNA-binding NarL/FixJ family response regulator
MPIKVFIVDDHYMVIEGIRSLLQNESSIEWIGHAGNAASCLAFLRTCQPDIVLMDINLPDMSGIDLCGEVKRQYPSCFVLGLSTFNDQSFILQMMDKGASGYLLKNAGRDELLTAMQQVMKGREYLSLEAAQTRQQKPNSTMLLTRREKEVLRLIADGQTNHEIANSLFVSITTVDTHRKNLLQKLQAKNTASLVKIAMEQHLI